MKNLYDDFSVLVKDIAGFDFLFNDLIDSKLGQKGVSQIKITKQRGRVKSSILLTSKTQKVVLNNGIDIKFDDIHYQVGLTRFVRYSDISYLNGGISYDKSIEWVIFLLKKYKHKYLEYAKLALKKFNRDMNSAFNLEFGSYLENHKEAFKTEGNYKKYKRKISQLCLLESLIRDIELEDQYE